jgi:hypothetical protein
MKKKFIYNAFVVEPNIIHTLIAVFRICNSCSNVQFRRKVWVGGTGHQDHTQCLPCPSLITASIPSYAQMHTQQHLVPGNYVTIITRKIQGKRVCDKVGSFSTA